MSTQDKDNWMNRGMQGAILALLAWNIYTTHELTINMAVLNEKVSQIEKLVKN
jgi:hypothetical protein